MWEIANLAQFIPQGDGHNLLEAWNGWEDLENTTLVRVGYVAYYIWVRRNIVVFEKFDKPNSVVVEMATRAATDFGVYNTEIYGGRPSPRPTASSVKFNADASVQDDGWVGLGVVARDCNGEIVLAATRRVRAWWPPAVVEGKALCLAIKLGRAYNYKDVVFETDCQTLVYRLSLGDTFFSDFDSILDDALFF